MKRLDPPKSPPTGDRVVRVDLPGRDPSWFRVPLDPIHCAALLQASGEVKGYGPQRAAICAILGYCWAPVSEQFESPPPDLDVTEPRMLAMLYGAAALKELQAADRPWSFPEINFAGEAVVLALAKQVRAMRDEESFLRETVEAAREREGFTGAR